MNDTLPPFVEALTLEGCEADLNDWGNNLGIWEFSCGLSIAHSFAENEVADYVRDMLYGAHQKHHYEGHIPRGRYPLLEHVNDGVIDAIWCDCKKDKDGNIERR